MTTAALAVLVAAQPQGPNADEVSPGLLGFLTVFGLALATVLLVRSMVKHLRKVRYSLGPDGKPWDRAGGPTSIPPRRERPGDVTGRGSGAGTSERTGERTGEGTGEPPIGSGPPGGDRAG